MRDTWLIYVKLENLPKKPQLIEGGISVDERGRVTYANGFHFEDVKRFYVVENFSTGTVRAWHGHLKEAKYVFVPSGSAIVMVVEIDDIEVPRKDSEIYRFTLSSRKPQVLYIPPGMANGFKAVEENTKVMFFSTASLKESKKDDYRFPYDYWGEKIWQVKNE